MTGRLPSNRLQNMRMWGRTPSAASTRSSLGLSTRSPSVTASSTRTPSVSIPISALTSSYRALLIPPGRPAFVHRWLIRW